MPPKSKKNNAKVFVAGLNSIKQISLESNDFNEMKMPIVCPPCNIKYISSDSLSYSIYFDHSVLANNDFAFSKGPNTGNHEFQLKPKKILNFAELNLKDKENNNCLVISAVCGSNYTLYQLISAKSQNPFLVCFCEALKTDIPVFIDIEDRVPIGLFGGRKIAAAIDSHGDVIIISPSVFSKADHKADIISLPNNEKSTYVACLEKSVLILSEKNKVYEYILGNQDSYVKEVRELNDKEIISLSGTYRHALAVSSEHEVFGRGLNEYGQLCTILNETEEFTEITELNELNITSAFAGCFHSLFIDSKGKVFSCGKNSNGELLFNENDPSQVSIPTETMIKNGAKFCIAGCQLSLVFVSMDPPPYSPNQIITDYIFHNPFKNSTPKANTNTEETAENISFNDPMAIRAKLVQMKEELEAKNKFFDLIQDQNKNVIKRLQTLDQKIDQFIKINKLDMPLVEEEEELNEPRKEMKPKKTNLSKKKQNKKPQDDLINYEPDSEEEEKPEKQPKTFNKNMPMKKKPSSNNYKSIIEDPLDSDEEEEKTKQQGKRANKNRQSEIIYNMPNYDDDDDDENGDDDENVKARKKPRPPKIKSNKKPNNLIKKRDQDDDDDGDEINYNTEKLTKLGKNNQQNNKNTLPKKRSIKNMKDDDEDIDDSDDDIIIPQFKKLAQQNNKKVPQKKKIKDDDDDDSDDENIISQGKKPTKQNNKKALQKKKIIDDEDDDEFDQVMINLKKPNQPNNKKGAQKKKTKPINTNIDDDDDDSYDDQIQNIKKQPTNKKSLQKKKKNTRDSDDDDIDNEQPKETKAKKVIFPNNKNAPAKKKSNIKIMPNRQE